MSHHFDTPTAKEDPRINLCDFYLFQGPAGSTVMAMTVNPNAGISAPETFREDGLYAFRFDLNGDAREEVTFKIRFGAVRHMEGDQHEHRQSFEARRATGNDALHGAEGETIAIGESAEVVTTDAGVKVYAGLAPDLFAGDAAALRTFLKAAYQEGRFYPDAFQNHQNFFQTKNVSVIVLEVPTSLIGQGVVRAWATVSLHGHAPEVQVSRWGLPLITHLFLSDPALTEMKEEYNRAQPADDEKLFGPAIAQFAERMARWTASATDPAEYARQVVAKLCPTTLPYRLGTMASFDPSAFNGRGLAEDVMDVILTIATDTPLQDGVAPDAGRIRKAFPYFGAPYSTEELNSAGK